MVDIELQVSTYDSKSVDSDNNSYSTYIECNCMTSCQEERVCDNCNYKLFEPKRSFHGDKLKYLGKHLLKKNTWHIGKGSFYDDYVKYHSLTSVAIKGIIFILEVLLKFLSVLGYTKNTLNYLHVFKLMYMYLGIDKNNKFIEAPKICNEKKWFHDYLWSKFLPYLNHVLDDKHKSDEQRRGWIIRCYSTSEIVRQQEWEYDYWLG